MSPHAFFALAGTLDAGLRGTEVLFSTFRGETSDFVRLNQGRIRQAGSVRAAALGLTLIDGQRQAEASCDLSGNQDTDLGRARVLLERLRERLAHMPEDPYLNYSTEPWESDHRVGEAAPDPGPVVADLVGCLQGLDLVGIWASGEIQDGLSSSIGHRNWHASQSFNLDWSCYQGGDRAIKASYSGLDWDERVLADRLDAVRRGIAVLGRKPRTLAPGRYRAYLAPAAAAELMAMLAWEGFDLKSHRTRQTPLLKLVRGERLLHPAITIREEHGRGLQPRFTAEGFAKPDRVTLIDGGRFAACLVDARDGKEYGEPVNASAGSPESIALEPGDLPDAEVLARLGTGIYIGNLWYCNWSDPNACRITGMTRFGTYWVEGGEIVAPLSVMRFDDSLYHLLGDRLEGVGAARELMISPQTYEGRVTHSDLLPGFLVSGIDLAL